MRFPEISSRSFYIFITAAVILSFAFTKYEQKEKSKSIKKTSDETYVIQINNIVLPLDNTGLLAESGGGKFDDRIFLYNGGFYLSGKNENLIWANKATYPSWNDYIPGTIKNGRNDARAKLYVVSKSEGDFAQSWLSWSDAVDLGADFYDGNPDGKYIPEDLNNNGIWDSHEDCPDILGDQTIWCVYNDGLESALRRFPGQEPQGIEIRQTVFGYSSSGPLGNVIFIRYKILNTGTKAELLDSVYFSVWNDPDLGIAWDDLVGCDTLLNAGFIYNKSYDQVYGSNPPCFLVDFFQGPHVYIPGETFVDTNENGFFDSGETPLQYAEIKRGRIPAGTIAGARIAGISSFINNINGHPSLSDPMDATTARNFMKGLDGKGLPLNPCTWNNGIVLQQNCKDINPYFWYSGDPVTKLGWLHTNEGDTRMMLNTGPFKLKAGEPVEIVAAYIMGRGDTPLSSVNEAKKNSALAQYFYDNNFVDPPDAPDVLPEVSTSEGLIDILWETSTQVNFMSETPAWDLRFEGYNVYAYKTNNPSETIDDHPNRKLITSYDMRNFINDIYKQDFLTVAVEKKFLKSSDDHQLDHSTYAIETGKIRLRITSDPFTGGPLIKGKPYYFAVTSYSLDYNNLFNRSGAAFGSSGDYVISSASIKSQNESTPKVFSVIVGEDLYSPPVDLIDAVKAEGPSSGTVTYDVVQKDLLNGHTYKVEFITDSSSVYYNSLWRLTDESTGEIKIDSCNEYLFNGSSIASDILIDGFIPRIKQLKPKAGTPRFTASDNSLNPFSRARATGVYYLGKDIQLSTTETFAGGKDLPALSTMKTSIVRADKLRRVELRFDKPGKAYRYLNGYFGSVIQRKGSYIFAEAITADDTIGKGPVGKIGSGFIDVPFTAWVVDTLTRETKQLAVGIIERSKALGGIPDGEWNPGENIRSSGEYIMVFDAPYDETGSQAEYRGITHNGKTIWADLKGYIIPKDVPGVSGYQRSAAASNWLNTLYLVGMEIKKNKNILPGSKLEIPVEVYPYTSRDVYRFTTKIQGKLTESERKELFSKVNVFPNPLFAYNSSGSYFNNNPDDSFITFSNLPEEVTIKIFTISGKLIKTLTTNDKQSGPDSPFIRWNLLNEYELRIASGIYLAIVSSPALGEKVLKFSVIMPQKDIQRF